MVALTIAMWMSIVASSEASEIARQRSADSNPIEDLFMPGKPFVPGMAPPVAEERVEDIKRNWGLGLRRRPVSSGGFIELNGTEKKKLQDEVSDVRVSQAALVSQERELRRMEKRFEKVSRTDHAVMHDYAKKYKTEKRQQKMFEAELRDNDRLNLYQANLIQNFTHVKSKIASLSEIEARCRANLAESTVNLTALNEDIASLESVNDTLNGESTDDSRFDVKQAELLVFGGAITEEFNNNVYRVVDILKRSKTLQAQMEKADVVLREIVREFVSKENHDSLINMMKKKGGAFQDVLRKFGIFNFDKDTYKR